MFPEEETEVLAELGSVGGGAGATRQTTGMGRPSPDTLPVLLNAASLAPSEECRTGSSLPSRALPASRAGTLSKRPSGQPSLGQVGKLDQASKSNARVSEGAPLTTEPARQKSI